MTEAAGCGLRWIWWDRQAKMMELPGCTWESENPIGVLF